MSLSCSQIIWKYDRNITIINMSEFYNPLSEHHSMSQAFEYHISSMSTRVSMTSSQKHNLTRTKIYNRII